MGLEGVCGERGDGSVPVAMPAVRMARSQAAAIICQNPLHIKRRAVRSLASKFDLV